MADSHKAEKIEDMLEQIDELESERNEHIDAPPEELGDRLKMLKARVAERTFSTALKQEKRVDLRLPIRAPVTLRLGSTRFEATCHEISVGGMLIGAPRPLSIGDELTIEGLELGDESSRLGVKARVVREASGGPGLGPSKGNYRGIQFIEIDPARRERIDAAFVRALRVAADAMSTAKNVSLGDLMVRNKRQLFSITQALLQRVGGSDLWTRQGPTTATLHHLRHNGEDLSEEARTVVLFVWRLWNGVCDLRQTELWNLDTGIKDAIVALVVAMKHDAEAVDMWLISHELRAEQ